MSSVFQKRNYVTWGALLGVLSIILMSCASTKPPTQELTRSEAAINQAEQVGAQEYAPLEIREARKKLQKAKELAGRGEHEKAR